MQVLSIATILVLLELSGWCGAAPTNQHRYYDTKRVVRRSVDLDSAMQNCKSYGSSSRKSDVHPIMLGVSQSQAVSEQFQKLFDCVGDMVKSRLAPPRLYLDLIVRYRKWFKQYKELQLREPRLSRDGLELIKEEYANVDKEFSQLECQLAQKLRQEQIKQAEEEGMPIEELGEDPERSRTENVDFMFKVLLEVIHRLEQRIGVHNNPGLTNTFDEPIDPLLEGSQDDELVKEAMEKLKRTVINTAREVATRELSNMALQAGFHAASIAIGQVAGIPPELHSILNIVVGTPSVSLAAKYLMDIKFRTALTTIGALIPAKCKLDNQVGSTASSVDQRGHDQPKSR